MGIVNVSGRELLQRGLLHRHAVVRILTVAGIALAAAVPVGATIGLAGAMYGSALLVALVVGCLMLRHIMVSLLVSIGVIILLPFAALPIDIGFAPTFLNLALAVTYFVWFGRLVTGRQDGFIARPPIFAVLVFVSLATVSFVLGLAHAPLTANVLRHFAQILMSVLLFVLVINTVRTRKQLDGLLIALMVAGSLAAITGIVLYVLPDELTARLLSMLRVVRYPAGDQVLRYVEDNPDLPLRATSTSVDPNVLGGMLIFVGVITTTQALAPRPVLPRGWIFAMLASIFVCLILTYSRGSFVGFAAAVGLLGLLRYRKALLIGLVVAALLLLLPPTQEYVAHFTKGVQGEDLATQMRFGEYRDALTLIQRYPWFGVGFSGTPDVDTYLGVSMVYLLIAEEMGVIGLLAFLAAMGSFFYAFARALRRCPPRSELEPALLGTSLAVAGAMVGGFLDHYLFNLDFPHAAALFWLVVGLGAVSARLVEDQDARHEPDAAAAPNRTLTTVPPFSAEPIARHPQRSAFGSP